MDKKQKKYLALALAILAIALFSGSTLAYYTVIGTATNVVTSGNIRMAIHETTKDDEPFPPDGIKVIPGDTVEKNISIENICDHPFWLRVKLVKGSSKETLSPEEVLQIATPDPGKWTWHEPYYYYSEILQPKETTDILFTEVHIVGDLVDQHDIGTALTVTVKAEAVQSEHNPAQNPWEASGWPAA